MRMPTLIFCVTLLAGCGQSAPEVPASPSTATPAPDVPSTPPLVELGPRQLLLECAGAIAAQSGLDPLADPSLGTAEENAYFTVLALMDKEPGLAGMEGRKAAAASRDAWDARSPQQRAARASECLTRFPG